MKTCLLCYHIESDKAPTCPKCGEATWAATSANEETEWKSSNHGAVWVDTKPELAVVPVEAPKKRGPGRPKKDSSS